MDGDGRPVTPVFGHGRLRLYLLKLLEDGPRHGYELIRVLEERFLGLYAPSAGTIYPRLQRMEAEGLVRHTAAGGRKTYEITDAGRAELDRRAGEVAALETDIRESVADLSGLARDIRSQLSGSMLDLRRGLAAVARDLRATGRPPRPVNGPPGSDPTPGPPGSDATPGARVDPPGRRVDPPGRGAGSGPQAGTATVGDGPLAELDRKVMQFAGEAWSLIRDRGITDAQARTAIRILDGALEGLRRLLR